MRETEHDSLLEAVVNYMERQSEAKVASLKEQHTLEIANLRNDNLALRNQIDTSGGGEKRRITEANKGKVKS